MKNKMLVTTLMLISMPFVFSQETQPLKLSLDDCIASALKHNLTIEIANYRRLIQQEDINLAKSKFEPSFFLESNTFRQKTPSFSLLQGADVLEQDGVNNSMGVRQKFPLGIDVEIAISGNYSKTNSQWVQTNPRWENATYISLNLPVLKNAGVESNYADVLVAEKNKDIAVLEVKQIILEQLFVVESAYWDLLYKKELVNVHQEMLEVARLLEKQNKEKYDKKLIPKVEVTSAEALVASREEELLFVTNQMYQAMDNLKQLINPALLYKDIDIELTQALPEQAPEFDQQKLIEQALALRPDYANILKQLETKEILIKKYKNQILPRVDLRLKYGLTGLDENFGNSYDQWRTGKFSDASGGIVLWIPIGNKLADAELKKVELENRLLKIRLADIKNQIVREVKKALRDISSAQKRIISAKKAVELSRQRFEIEDERYRVQQVTLLSVRDAQKEYINARASELKAKVDLAIALSNLYRITGKTLEKANTMSLLDKSTD